MISRASISRQGVVRRRGFSGATALAFVAVLAGCGGAAGGSSGAPDTAGVTPQALAQAGQNLAPVTGRPSPFPVSAPLLARPPAGSSMALLQCSTPICALIGRMGQEAAGQLGTPLTVTKAGASAQSLQEAMSSIIAQKPTAVLIPAADPVQYREPMNQLDQLGIPVVSQGVVDGDKFAAIKGTILGTEAARRAGTLLADWVVKRNGAKPVVFYNIPELSFSPFIVEGFTKEMGSLCPQCEVRFVDVPISTIGNRAPATVVSDLQVHPTTGTAVFGSAEAANGLPAALKVAGIQVDTVGFAPDPAVLGYIKNGDITAGLGYDIRTTTWVQVDMAARLMTGQPLEGAETTDPSVLQMLEQRDITFDPTKGFNGYPDVADRFARLWSGPATS